MTIKVKKTFAGATLPTSGSKCAAGYDLYAHTENGTQQISAGETVKIGTGICVEIPDGYFGAVFARSGLATKRGLRPSNCVGVIDSDYRGEVIVALHNDSKGCETIHEGDRIAQLVIMPYLAVDFQEVKELNDTERGSGGFGSTGVSVNQEYEQLTLFDMLDKGGENGEVHA